MLPNILDINYAAGRYDRTAQMVTQGKDQCLPKTLLFSCSPSVTSNKGHNLDPPPPHQYHFVFDAKYPPLFPMSKVTVTVNF